MNNDIKKEVLNLLAESIKSKVASHLEGYSSPLTQIVNEVVDKHTPAIRKMVDEFLTESLGSSEFRTALKEEFNHKIAKTMVGKLEGSVEKAVEVLRQDQTLRAKMVVALDNIIKENSVA